MASSNLNDGGPQSLNSLGTSSQPVTKTRRRSRYNAANEYLQSACADFINEPGESENSNSTSKDHSSNDFKNFLEPALHGWRSEHPSEVSSHLCQPKWPRLIRAVGSLVADQISRNVVDLKRQLSKAPFVSVDSTGGGSVKDLVAFLGVCLEAMNLNDKDTGYILIDAYHHLQADDLPLNSQTWRALLVTSLLAAAKTVLADSKEQMAAIAAVQSHVAHWWTVTQASKAYKVFTQRETFKQLSPSQRADLYFELRDLALRMDYEEDSNASAVNLMDSDPSLSNSMGDLSPKVLRKGVGENSLEMSESENWSSIISL